MIVAWTWVKSHLSTLLLVAALVAVTILGYQCGKRSDAGQVAELTTQLAQSEKTVELKDGLYATKVIEATGLKGLLDTSQASVAALKKQLDDTQAQLLTTQQLVITWKQAYAGAVKATQSDGGKSTTDPVKQRERVDFMGGLGPIDVTGYTMTDPAEAHLSIIQSRPLKLTVSVARNKDGTWSSYVTSSDPNVQADVTLGGVDPGVTAPTWRERIWLQLGMDFVGDKRASAGLSYQFDRFSVGASCSAWTGGDGCGLTVGFRPFK